MPPEINKPAPLVRKRKKITGGRRFWGGFVGLFKGLGKILTWPSRGVVEFYRAANTAKKEGKPWKAVGLGLLMVGSALLQVGLLAGVGVAIATAPFNPLFWAAAGSALFVVPAIYIFQGRVRGHNQGGLTKMHDTEVHLLHGPAAKTAQHAIKNAKKNGFKSEQDTPAALENALANVRGYIMAAKGSKATDKELDTAVDKFVQLRVKEYEKNPSTMLEGGLAGHILDTLNTASTPEANGVLVNIAVDSSEDFNEKRRFLTKTTMGKPEPSAAKSKDPKASTAKSENENEKAFQKYIETRARADPGALQSSAGKSSAGKPSAGKLQVETSKKTGPSKMRRR